MSFWNSIYFQDSASPFFSELKSFNDHVMILTVAIGAMVILWVLSVNFKKISSRLMIDHPVAELIWTAAPMVVLFLVTMPSLRLLYMMDETGAPELTVKVIGSQWYWSYEYSDFPSLEFDSYMIHETKEEASLPRLLQVDNRVTLPVLAKIRFLISASDVLHSWSVPALGLKIDAVPGRLNQIKVNLSRYGLFFGQCSEICGANHSFMPIVLESVPLSHFLVFSSC